MKNLLIGSALGAIFMFAVPAVASVVSSLQVVTSTEVPETATSTVTKVLDSDTGTICYTFSKGGISCVKR